MDTHDTVNIIDGTGTITLKSLKMLLNLLDSENDLVEVVEHVSQTDRSPGVQLAAAELLETLGFSATYEYEGLNKD